MININLFITVLGAKKEQVLDEFSANSKHLKHRKNGVYLYHEIISISRSKSLSNEEQKQALYEIVQEYTKRRAFGNLACGYMHDEKENNLHFHLMISSNEVGKSNRTSLRKKEFSTLKVEMEKWVLQKYPELGQEKIISKTNQYKDKKEEFTDSLQSILSTAKSRDELHKLLENNEASYKVRGKSITFTNGKTGKKHLLNTLGLGSEYALMEARFEGKEDIYNRSKKKNEEPKDRETFKQQKTEKKTHTKDGKPYIPTDDTSVKQKSKERLASFRAEKEQTKQNKAQKGKGGKAIWLVSLLVDKVSNHISEILKHWFVKKNYLALLKTKRFRADNQKAHGNKKTYKNYNFNNNRWR